MVTGLKLLGLGLVYIFGSLIACGAVVFMLTIVLSTSAPYEPIESIAFWAMLLPALTGFYLMFLSYRAIRRALEPRVRK